MSQYEQVTDRVNSVIKQLRQSQERGVDFLNDDIVNLIRDLHNWLGTEQSMHGAWRKRAEEAEAQVATLTQERDSLREALESTRQILAEYEDDNVLTTQLKAIDAALATPEENQDEG